MPILSHIPSIYIGLPYVLYDFDYFLLLFETLIIINIWGLWGSSSETVSLDDAHKKEP